MQGPGSGYGPPGFFTWSEPEPEIFQALGFSGFLGQKDGVDVSYQIKFGILPLIHCMAGLSLCSFLFRKWENIEEGRALLIHYIFKKEFPLQGFLSSKCYLSRLISVHRSLQSFQGLSAKPESTYHTFLKI